MNISSFDMSTELSKVDAVIAIGSNLAFQGAPPVRVVRDAIGELGGLGAARARSGLWSSPAWPDPREPAFVNAVVRLTIERPAESLLRALQGLEARFGRERSVKNAARTLDLDVIDVAGVVMDAPDLTLPHPRAAERAFVLEPLADVAPTWRHPKTGASVAALLAALPTSARAGVRRLTDRDA